MDAMQIVVAELQKVHRLSERDAASIALTVQGVVDMVPKPAGQRVSRCPFDLPDHNISPDEPCPVCGMGSGINAEILCVSN